MVIPAHNRCAVRADEICYTYPEGTRALEHINLSIDQGQFVALLASNGSGKTTLLKILLGLLKPQTGAVSILGENITKLSQEELYQKVGMVFQNPQDQLFAPTVEADVAFGPRNLNLPEDEIQLRVTESLKDVAVDDLRKRAIHHLSFGQQKRVAIAGVLAMRPPVILLDEPTASLDPAAEWMMMRLLHRLNAERNMTIVMATHSVDMLPLFAHKIVVLHKGAVRRQGLPEEIFHEHDILKETGLRMPYISSLFNEMKHRDSVRIEQLPLTISEARRQVLGMISDSAFINSFQGGPNE